MRKPLPAKYADAPRVFPWLQLFYEAFEDLVGDRPQTDAPIPWSTRQKWAEVHGLDEIATELLHTHVKALDLAFLNSRRDNRPDEEMGKKPDGVVQ